LPSLACVPCLCLFATRRVSTLSFLFFSEKSPSLSPPDTQSAHDYQSVRSRAQTHHRWLMSHVYAYCGLAGWRRWLSDYSPAFCAVSSCTSRHEWSVPSTPRDGLFDSLHIVCSPEDMLSINAQTVLRKLSGFAYFEKDLVCFQGMACQILQLGAARARLFLVPFGSSSSRGAAWCLVTLRLTRRAEACRTRSASGTRSARRWAWCRTSIGTGDRSSPSAPSATRRATRS